MRNKARALKELADEDFKTQLARGYKNIPNGANVLIVDDNFQNLYGNYCIVKYKGNTYHVSKRDLDFKIQRKIYILSNSYDGIEDIKGDYLAIDDMGKVLYQKYCSAKKFAKKDLVLGDTQRFRECSDNYGKDFKLLFLGEDRMTLDKLVQIHNENYPNN